MCLYISFSSCFEVVPSIQCFRELFVLLSWVLQHFHPEKSYYRTCCSSVHFIAAGRSFGAPRENVFISHSSHFFLRNRKNETAIGLLVSDFCFIAQTFQSWCELWFEDSQEQDCSFFPFTTCISQSATDVYYSPIGNPRSAIHSEQIDGIFSPEVLRNYNQPHFGAYYKKLIMLLRCKWIYLMANL